MSNLVVVATFSFPHDANFAKMNLEASGIPAFVADEHTVNMQWLYSDAVGGVRLFVEQNNVEKALEILNGEISVIYEEELNSDFSSEIKEEFVEDKSPKNNSIVKLGFNVIKILSWLFIFRSVYFSLYSLSTEGIIDSILILIYLGWIPTTFLYLFYKYHK